MLISWVLGTFTISFKYQKRLMICNVSLSLSLRKIQTFKVQWLETDIFHGTEQAGETETRSTEGRVGWGMVCLEQERLKLFFSF